MGSSLAGNYRCKFNTLVSDMKHVAIFKIKALDASGVTTS